MKWAISEVHSFAHFIPMNLIYLREIKKYFWTQHTYTINIKLQSQDVVMAIGLKRGSDTLMVDRSSASIILIYILSKCRCKGEETSLSLSKILPLSIQLTAWDWRMPMMKHTTCHCWKENAGQPSHSMISYNLLIAICVTDVSVTPCKSSVLYLLEERWLLGSHHHWHSTSRQVYPLQWFCF